MFDGVRSIIGRRLSDSEGGNIQPEKQSLSIKGTPLKDLETTLKYSIHHTSAQKRNEQGTWVHRHICMVPHMFLYYFDDKDNNTSNNNRDSSSSSSSLSQPPKGIIDLEYYTQLETDKDSGILTLFAPGTNLRKYYFRFDEENVVNDWISAVKRDRFQLVKDERDAYQALQEQFSGQINASANIQEAMERDKERLLLEVAETRKQAEDVVITIQRLLHFLELGTQAEELELQSTGTGSDKTNSIAIAGKAIEDEIRKLKDDHDKALKDKDEDHADRIKAIEMQLNDMEQSKCQLERFLAMEKSCKEATENESREKELTAENRYKDAMGQIAMVGESLDQAQKSRESSEEKAALLSSQKKLLVKEVKVLRTKEKEQTDAIIELEKGNSTLKSDLKSKTDECNSLKQRMTQYEERIQKLEQDVSNAKTASAAATTTNTAAAATNTATATTTTPLRNASHGSTSTSAFSFGIKKSVGILNRNDEENENVRVGTNTIETESDTTTTTTTTTSSITDNDDNLKLSPFAANTQPLVQVVGSGVDSAASGDLNEAVMTHSPSSPADESATSTSNTVVNTYQNTTTSANGSVEKRRNSILGAMNSIKSVFSKGVVGKSPQNDNDGNNDSLSATGNVNNSSLNATNNADKVENIDEDRDRSFVFRCYRCNGTVEGPKYSTCKCTEPALRPEDITNDASKSTGGRFSNFFKRVSLTRNKDNTGAGDDKPKSTNHSPLIRLSSSECDNDCLTIKDTVDGKHDLLGLEDNGDNYDVFPDAPKVRDSLNRNSITLMRTADDVEVGTDTDAQCDKSEKRESGKEQNIKISDIDPDVSDLDSDIEQRPSSTASSVVIS